MYSLKWSYTDTAYYAYGYEHFFPVETLFAQRGSLHEMGAPQESEREFYFRIYCMTQAMRTLDDRGVFSERTTRLPRAKVCVLVETMPPDVLSIPIAAYLNDVNMPVVQEWLEYAAAIAG